jgi:hypothetical protein
MGLEGFIFAIQDRVINTRNYKNTYAVYNRSLINVGFAELKGKPLNTSFLLATFWLKANIRNVMIYSLKLQPFHNGVNVTSMLKR